MIDKPLPYAHQHISEEDIEAVSQALAQPVITRGPLVESFENTLATYCGAAYAVAFNSASSALLAAYAAVNVEPGDVLFSTPNTFISTVSGAILRGANPIFLDIDSKTGNLSLEQLSLNINRPHLRGKNVVIPVHFAGIPVDIQAIDQFILDPKTIIIEDAAHALGSHYKNGQKVGCCARSHMTIFSFHPAKTITTGEGGMVLTNDQDLYHRLRIFRDNGIERTPRAKEIEPWIYDVVSLSSNYHLTEFQAALGLSQLKRIDAFISKRQALLKTYQKLLADFEHLSLLQPEEGLYVSPHLCVVQINFEAYQTTRAQVMKKLSERGIGTQVHYIPLYRHPYFSKKAGELAEYYPEMETYYSQALSLPLFFDLNEEDVIRVTTELKRALLR